MDSGSSEIRLGENFHQLLNNDGGPETVEFVPGVDIIEWGTEVIAKWHDELRLNPF